MLISPDDLESLEETLELSETTQQFASLLKPKLRSAEVTSCAVSTPSANSASRNDGSDGEYELVVARPAARAIAETLPVTVLRIDHRGACIGRPDQAARWRISYIP